MHNENYRKHFFYLILILFLVLILGLSNGFVTIPIVDVFYSLLGKSIEKYNFIIWTIRLPRILMTMLVGMALAFSGNILQSIVKNDLADPGILGINAGAGLGVSIAYLYMDFTRVSIVYALPIIGFIAAMITFSITLFLSKDPDGRINVDKLILIGIGSSISFSGAMIVFISSAGREDVQFISKWLSGNIWGDKWPFVLTMSLISTFIIILVYFKSHILDIMRLDHISATSLGVDLKKERRFFVLAAVALSSLAVSLAGSISFIGLIVPHIARKIFGQKHKYNLGASMLIGSIFLTIADIIGQNILKPQGLLTGIVVSIIGAPYFLFLIIKKK